MTELICPRCQRRIVCDSNEEDIMHECNSGNLALDEEDVLVVGDWEDYSGTGTPKNVMSQGIGNKLWGTRAWIQGENPKDVTKRGNSTSNHRQRKHIEFIKIGERK